MDSELLTDKLDDEVEVHLPDNIIKGRLESFDSKFLRIDGEGERQTIIPHRKVYFIR